MYISDGNKAVNPDMPDSNGKDEHLEAYTEPFYTNQEEDPANAFYFLDLWLDD